MEFLLEFFFSIFGELLLQLLAEFLFHLGFHSLAETVTPREKRNPVLAFFGYVLFGIIIGGLSLVLFPELLLDDKSHSLGNLIVTPILAGLMMNTIGVIRKKQEKNIIRLDSFLFGFIFAFAMGIVRYTFGS